MKLLDSLQNTNSRVVKEALLSSATELEIKSLVFAYNPNYVYHVGKDSWPHVGPLGEPIAEMFVLLEKVLSGLNTPAEAKDTIEAFANHNGDLIKLIATKDLRCGIAATTINRVWPKLIPVYKIQKAKVRDISLLRYPQFCQLKYDGVRLTARVENGTVTFKSSSGKVACFPDLAEGVINSKFVSGVLDGELIWDKGLKKDRTIISGKLNSAMHGGVVDESKITFKVFDFLSLTEFNIQKCISPLYIRRAQVDTIVTKLINNPMYESAETESVASAEEVNRVYNKYIESGYEGVILKNPDSLYTFKRSNDWVKIKEVKDADLHCYGYEEGTGRNEGLIGALLCSGSVEGKEVQVKVGTGLSDLDRQIDPSEYVGKTVEMQYNTVIQDSVTKQYSLFLPRFIMIRHDK